MSDVTKPQIGEISWIDLTVANAEEVRDFYNQVIGWKFEPVNMGDYSDFTMLKPADGTAAAGICHARGVNANLPAQWMIYITVADVDESARKVKTNGGNLLIEPKNMSGYGRYCVIQDPSGAVAALFAPAE